MNFHKLIMNLSSLTLEKCYMRLYRIIEKCLQEHASNAGEEFRNNELLNFVKRKRIHIHASFQAENLSNQQ